MKKVLCIGNKITYDLYKRGMTPSHWLYGVIEFEKKDYKLINYEYQGNSLIALISDIYAVLKNRPDIIYIPYFNIKNHALLLLLIRLKLIRPPLVTFLHRTPHASSISYFLIKGVAAAFFLSPKNKEEVINLKMLKQEICHDACWGPDLEFYDKYRSQHKRNYFISTGKEHRDYTLLIDVFSGIMERLKIITCRFHAGADYSYLLDLVMNKSNIELQLGEDSGHRFREMLFLMSEAKSLVCPLEKSKITYCVGLSTIADAMALGLPVIITRNPYHAIDVDKEKTGIVVNSKDDWINAINRLNNPDLIREYGENARNLAECKYNINICAEKIMRIFESLSSN